MSVLRWPMVIGHRGAALHAPENTLASFSKAYELGCAWVEMDVQLAACGQPVIFHDETLDRTTDGQGPLAVRSLAELKKLDAGSWFGPQFRGQRIPTLKEALDHILGLGMGVNIEIKAPRSRAAASARVILAEALAAWPSCNPLKPLISSFSPEALEVALAMCPAWPRGYLVKEIDAARLAVARGLKASVINPPAGQVSALEIAAAKAAGLDILAWTVNDPAKAAALWRRGVDGLFSDAPERLIAQANAL
jgi:glycerophosphoryl diester phosphodiesterase